MVITKESDGPELNKSYGNSMLEESLLTGTLNETLCTEKENESLSSTMRYESLKSGTQNQSYGTDSINKSLELYLRRNSLESNLQELVEPVQKSLKSNLQKIESVQKNLLDSNLQEMVEQVQSSSLESTLQKIELVQKNSVKSYLQKELIELELQEEILLDDSHEQADSLSTGLHNKNIKNITKFDVFFEALEQENSEDANLLVNVTNINQSSQSNDSDDSFAAGVDLCSSKKEYDLSVIANSNVNDNIVFNYCPTDLLIDSENSERNCTDNKSLDNKNHVKIGDEICSYKSNNNNNDESFNENIDAGENTDLDSECTEGDILDEDNNDGENDDNEGDNDNNDDEGNDDNENDNSSGSGGDDGDHDNEGDDNKSANDPNDDDDEAEDDVNDESDDNSRTRSNAEAQEFEESGAVATSQESKNTEKYRKMILAKYKSAICPYCLNEFSNSNVPKTLTCGHNLCSVCIPTILKDKRLKNCPLCDAKLNYIELREAKPNHALSELIDKIFKSEFRHMTSIEQNPGALESIINIASHSEDPKDSYFLGPIQKMESDLNAKLNAIKSFLDMIDEQTSKLQQFKAKYVEYAEEFKESKNELEQAKTIDEIHECLTKVHKVIEKFQELQYERLIQIPDKIVTLSSDLKNCFMVTGTITDLKNLEELMSSTTNQFYFQKDLIIERRARKIFAKVEYKQPYLFLHSFTDRFPDGYSIFFDFRPLEEKLKRKASCGVFMDIVHASGRENPNRIYAKLEKNFISIYEEYFSGRKQKTFLDADIENQGSHITIKNYLTTDEEVMCQDVLSEDMFSEGVKYKKGDIVVAKEGSKVANEGCKEMLRILRTPGPFKNVKICRIGTLCDYSFKELKMIKGKSYIKNCGVYVKLDQ